MAAANAPSVVTSNRRVSPHCVMMKPPLSRTRAEVASLLARRSSSARSSCRISSSRSWGRLPISGRLAGAFVDELVEQHAGHHVQGLKNSVALMRGGTKGRHLHFPVVQEELHVIDGRRIWQ